MNLKDLITVRGDSEVAEGVRVPWDETGDVGFVVSYCGKKAITKARKKSLQKKLNPKTHQFEEDIDEEKFDFELMNAMVQGWWGLKAKHVPEILDPTIFNIEITDPETEIPFTPESKDILIKNYNLTFNRFITTAAMDIETYQRFRDEQAIKNSKTSQTGSDKKDSPAGNAKT